MKVAVKTLENKDAGEITLEKSVFGIEANTDSIHKWLFTNKINVVVVTQK